MLVDGRYYFAEPGTPHAPQHNLGSYAWHSTNFPIEVDLGEISRKPVYDYGEPPSVLPQNHIVGTLDCLKNGERETFPFAQTIAGFVPGCFKVEEQTDRWPIVSEFATCRVQLECSKIITHLYDGDSAAVTAQIQSWLGVGLAINVRISNTNLPSCVTVIGPDWGAIFMDGTRFFQTLALQAFQSLAGPVNMGIYSTMPLWWDSASALIEFLRADGFQPDFKLFVSGHSYGAAVALNISSRLKAARPSRLTRYLTFASPKLGDERFTKFISDSNGFEILNLADIVGILPPDFELLAAVAPIYAISLLRLFNQWKQHPSRYLMDDDGRIWPNRPFAVETALLKHLIDVAIAHGNIDPIEPHSMDEYLRRLVKRCPGGNVFCAEFADKYDTKELTVDGPDYSWLLTRSIGSLDTSFPWLFDYFDPGGPFETQFQSTLGCNDQGIPDTFSITFAAQTTFGLGVEDFSIGTKTISVKSYQPEFVLQGTYETIDLFGHLTGKFVTITIRCFNAEVTDVLGTEGGDIIGTEGGDEIAPDE